MYDVNKTNIAKYNYYYVTLVRKHGFFFRFNYNFRVFICMRLCMCNFLNYNNCPITDILKKKKFKNYEI